VDGWDGLIGGPIRCWVCLLGWTFAVARRVTGRFRWRKLKARRESCRTTWNSAKVGITLPEHGSGLIASFSRLKDGESPESILGAFPMAGPLVRVYRAIIFYLEHKDEVEAYLQDQERLWAEVETMQTKLPDALSGRLREAREHAGISQP
jgi:hypothetical protein